MAEHDHIVINTAFFGPVRVQLKDIDMTWPPPEFIVYGEDAGGIRKAIDDDDRHEIFRRRRMSALTDEQIAKCPNVARGAEYVYVVGLDDDDESLN